jgi:hypothetical protein
MQGIGKPGLEGETARFKLRVDGGIKGIRFYFEFDGFIEFSVLFQGMYFVLFIVHEFTNFLNNTAKMHTLVF